MNDFKKVFVPVAHPPQCGLQEDVIRCLIRVGLTSTVVTIRIGVWPSLIRMEGEAFNPFLMMLTMDVANIVGTS